MRDRIASRVLNHARTISERLLPGHLLFGPTTIVLGVNNFCNLRCVMCDVGTGNGETNFGGNLTGAKTRSMSIELFKRIADEVAATWPSVELGFAFTEPLAWPPLTDALAYARDRGLRSSVTTNGLLLPRCAEAFVASGCRVLQVSLDGPEAIHDRIRRRTGSYARAVAGIEAVSAASKDVSISVYCTITEWERRFLAAVSARHGSFAAQACRPDPQQFHHRLPGTEPQSDLRRSASVTSSNVFETDPTKIDLDELSAELTEITQSVYPFPVTIQPNITELDELITYYRRPEVFVGRRCNDVYRMFMIDSDGEVIPVHGRCFRFPVANIRDASLKQIWHHQKLSELRRTLKRSGGLLPACSRCCSGFGHGKFPASQSARASN
jgi:MoaA/NifB/PqqE/SkfB family radical SAM enzyme